MAWPEQGRSMASRPLVLISEFHLNLAMCLLGRKEAEGEGATDVPPARAAVAAPRSGHRRGALAPPPCPFQEIGRKREGGEEK